MAFPAHERLPPAKRANTNTAEGEVSKKLKRRQVDQDTRTQTDCRYFGILMSQLGNIIVSGLTFDFPSNLLNLSLSINWIK